ncbi:MAG TPA: P-loop domain-containing protein [Planctomycetota bacterium]|nr:P-loop domain-containing protein [Planctomycetota bacterium]
MPSPWPVPIAPQAALAQARPRRDLMAALARIDGWGLGAWREVLACWRLGAAVLAVEPVDGGEQLDANATLVIDDRRFPPAAPGTAVADACADWLLRRADALLVPGSPVRCATLAPNEAVLASNACWLDAGTPPVACLRLRLRLPMQGMGIDGQGFARFVRRIERVLALTRSGWRAHARAVALQRALRAALPAHGLVAFLGDGARIARRGERPAPGCRPLRAPADLATVIDLGAFGRVRGLGIGVGITALAGAAYHGKSTLMQAIAAGRYDHPPGDGRELVVADAGALTLQAEDGRRIKRQDLSGFFAGLPGGDARDFTTERASGATSMAASLLQGVAAGSRLLLVDEDSAASNFLALDPAMRRLLGPSARGGATLVECLPALADAGVSVVIVAGAGTAALAPARRVLLLDRFRVRDRTARARRFAPKVARLPLAIPRRVIVDDGDRLLGPRHFLRVDARDPLRPTADGVAVDLRRCGWDLDEGLARGAYLAAAWCCRLAGGAAIDLDELGRRYAAFIAERGVRGLDPYDTTYLAAPPWALVATVLERLPAPALRSRR